MAVFRIERTRDYTVMSNHHLRNHELSLKAKGLLSMMLSLPDDWNYTTRGLAKICKEGVDAIGNALRELETAGYIVRHQLRDRQGRISDTEYVIYEQPQPRQPETLGPENNYLWIKYRFHSLPGASGSTAAGTERKGCDVCLRDGKLSGFDSGEHRVRPPVPGVYHLPGGPGRDCGADGGDRLRQAENHPDRWQRLPP